MDHFDKLSAGSEQLILHTDPHLSYLSLWPPDRRRLARKQLDSGELSELEFDAVVFRNVPNANFLRFRDEDMHSFATSFTGQPFLRNHDTHDIGSRDGTITQSHYLAGNFHQHIAITTKRGMTDFLEGRIDRFSIGWYYDAIHCSVCNEDWMSCSHWPGRKYKVDNDNRTCELIFISPKGKETSAVNAPAVPGTHVLSQLMEMACQHQKPEHRLLFPMRSQVAHMPRSTTISPIVNKEKSSIMDPEKETTQAPANVAVLHLPDGTIYHVPPAQNPAPPPSSSSSAPPPEPPPSKPPSTSSPPPPTAWPTALAPR